MLKKRLLVVSFMVLAICGLTMTCFSLDSPLKPSIIKVVVTVNPSNYDGPSPAKLTFTGTISARTTSVTYLWERSDGATSEQQTVIINGSGSVEDTWQFGAPGKHYRVYEKLHILKPYNIISEPAWASVSCK